MVLACALIFVLAAPALSREAPVGKLTYFSGEVIIKSKGSWAGKPTINHLLYSSDKVVTRLGTATITFNDGAVVKIANNSNLLIKEQVEKGKGTRRLRLILGKLSFRSGISKQKRDTIFETPTGVAAIRGTAGTLSVDGDYNSYITFTEGGIAYKVGDFIDGTATPNQAMADLNPAQRAAFVAKAAADQAAKASAGKDDDKALCYALAAEAAATEVKIAAQIMLENNPDPEVIKAVKKALKDAEKAIDDAQTLRGELVDKGANCGPEAFEEDAKPGVDIPKTTGTDTDPGDPI